MVLQEQLFQPGPYRKDCGKPALPSKTIAYNGVDRQGINVYCKTVASGKGKTKYGWFLFWIAFFIGTTLLFVINREKVQASLAVLNTMLNNSPAPEAASKSEEPARLPEDSEAPPGLIGPDAPLAEPQTAPEPQADFQTAADSEAPDPQPGTQTAPGARNVRRVIYMIRPYDDGALVPAKVERALPPSDSPMQDAIEAVIKGPSTDEAKRRLKSLIPAGVKILGATVRGNTAYVNFSEEFLFNTYGIEGYAGQLRQIVWTATEFRNVNDIQILVDGKRIDYLGEGIWIGSPLSRDNL